MTCTTSYQPVQFPINVIFLFYSLIPATLSLFGNLLVVVTVARKRTLRMATNILLAGMATSDLTVTACCQLPFTFYFAFNISGQSCTIVEGVKVMATSLTITSISILTVITHERYRTFTRGLQATKEPSRLEAVLCVLFSWTLGFLLGTGFLYVDPKAIGAITCVHIIGCLAYICFCYRRIMRYLKMREIELTCNSTGIGDTILMTHLLRRERRCLRAIVLILLVLFVTLLPLLAMIGYTFYVRARENGKEKNLVHLWTWTTTTVFFNGAANPFIYSARYSKLGREMRKTLKGIFTYFLCCWFGNKGILRNLSARRSSQVSIETKSTKRSGSLELHVKGVGEIHGGQFGHEDEDALRMKEEKNSDVAIVMK